MSNGQVFKSSSPLNILLQRLNMKLCCTTCVGLICTTLLVVVNGTDFCKGLGNVPGIPREKPISSYLIKSCHVKLMNGWRLMAEELNMTYVISNQVPNEGVDIVWSCFEPVPMLSNRLNVFGPQFDIFPGDKSYSGWTVARYTEGHTFYNALTSWNVDVHAGMGGWKYPMVTLKYPVDVDVFKSPIPMTERAGGFIYFKRRDPKLLAAVENFLKARQVHNVTIFHYINRYDEKEYIRKLQSSAWGIWIGQHESQGFAFEEALSLDVPLMVIDVTSMRDEGGGCPGGPWCYFAANVNLNASSAATWTPSCGEIVLTFDEFAAKWDTFQRKIASNSYAPRHLVMNTVAPKPCAARLIQLYNLHRNNWCEQYLQKQSQGPVKNYFNMSYEICEYDCLDGKNLF